MYNDEQPWDKQYLSYIVISNPTDYDVKFCINAWDSSWPTTKYFISSRWEYRWRTVWLQAIYAQPLPSFFINPYVSTSTDESTTVLRYNDLGLTLFCEGDNPTLACIDVANEDCTLFGEHIFDLEERDLVNMMVKNNITEQDVDEEDWGERRVTFNEGNIDFYYDNGELVSIIMGAWQRFSAQPTCLR